MTQLSSRDQSNSGSNVVPAEHSVKCAANVVVSGRNRRVFPPYVHPKKLNVDSGYRHGESPDTTSKFKKPQPDTNLTCSESILRPCCTKDAFKSSTCTRSELLEEEYCSRKPFLPNQSAHHRLPMSTTKTDDRNLSEIRLDVEDRPVRVNDDYVKALVRCSKSTAMYGGFSGDIDPLIVEHMKIDKLFIPIREDGVFKEGERKRRCTRHVVVHSRDMLSHSYLSSNKEGVLHVLLGWDHSHFISDFAYRFDTAHTHRNSRVPFLNGVTCTVRTSVCNGVQVCPNCPPNFREAPHSDVDPEDRNILEAVQVLTAEEEARKKADGVYAGIKARSVHCRIYVRKGKAVTICGGSPVVVRATNPKSDVEWFVGCSNYGKYPIVSEDVNGVKKRHYSKILDFPEHIVRYFQELFEGTATVAQVDGDCTYVAPKRGGRRTCPRHHKKLVEVQCTSDETNGPCFSMATIEPVGQNDIPLEDRVLYVSCIGEHRHPAPPPMKTTIRKLAMLEEVYESMKITELGPLRLEVERRLRERKHGSKTEFGVSTFNGSVVVPESSARRRLTRIRQQVPVIAREIGELSILAADAGNKYVRDSKMVDGGYVFFLATDEGLLHATKAMAFAGDATFKTVTERNRQVEQKRWYLYNIVTSASTDRLNEKGIVVMRALMTGLSKNCYYAVWKYFLDSMIRGANLLRDVDTSALGHGCINVPYVTVARTLEGVSCPVSSVTMDFDSAEIHGCAEAFNEVTGGTVKGHIEHLMVGCRVHLQRDLLRRSRDAERQRQTGMTERELYAMYRAYADAKNKDDATVAFEKLKNIDSKWTDWVEAQEMAPLLCKALSRMDKDARALAFTTTNIVESQNRRGNVYVGTHNRPGDAARKLEALDRADTENLGEGEYNRIVVDRGPRNRSDSILRPSGGSTSSTTKRRSKVGGGPVQKKVRRKKSMAGAVSNQGNIATTPTVTTTPTTGTEADVHERVLQMLSAVETKLDTIGGGVQQDSDTPEIVRSRRMDAIVTLLSAVSCADGNVNSLRKILIGAMQHHQKDNQFRDELFSVFRACLTPTTPPVHGTQGDGAAVSTPDVARGVEM